MSDQKYPYDPQLAARFINLAMAAEAQCDWEVNDPDHPDIEDPFAIPLACYDKLFAVSHMGGEAVKHDVEGSIREEYELVGPIRLGHQPVADYEDIDQLPSLIDAQDFDAVLELMTLYRRRVSETITNTVRYNRSNLLMGFALRSLVDGHGVIVLRGTMTTEEWLNNMNYQMTPFLPAKNAEFGEVHQGFRNIYKGLRGRYREMAAEFAPDKPIYLVGHSLGAAVSTIGALDLVLQQPERAGTIQAYLFGSPRTGDTLFAQQYNQLVGTSYRIVNVCDVVPYIPFEEMSTVADMLGYPYADTKGEVAFVYQAGNPISNHVTSYHIATREPRALSVTDASQPMWLV